MSLVKWKNDVNKFPAFAKLLDGAFGADITDFMGNWEGTTPSVNILETKDYFRVELAAPGMSKEDFDLRVEQGYLVISGKKEESKKEKKSGENEKYHRREFSYSAFQRTFSLPEVVDSDKIEANYHDGILLVNLPKKEEVKKRQEVKTISIS